MHPDDLPAECRPATVAGVLRDTSLATHLQIQRTLRLHGIFLLHATRARESATTTEPRTARHMNTKSHDLDRVLTAIHDKKGKDCYDASGEANAADSLDEGPLHFPHTVKAVLRPQPI